MPPAPRIQQDVHCQFSTSAPDPAHGTALRRYEDSWVFPLAKLYIFPGEGSRMYIPLHVDIAKTNRYQKNLEFFGVGGERKKERKYVVAAGSRLASWIFHCWAGGEGYPGSVSMMIFLGAMMS